MCIRDREVTAADERQTTLSYVFPLFRYHERWKEVNLADAEPRPLMKHSIKKGHVYLRDISPQAYPDGFMEPTGETAVFDESALAYTEKSIALCKEKGIDVVDVYKRQLLHCVWNVIVRMPRKWRNS